MKFLVVVLAVLLVGCASTGNTVQNKKSAVDSIKGNTQIPFEARLPMTPLSNGSASNLEEYLGKGSWTLVMFWSSVMHVSMTQEVRSVSSKVDKSTLQVVGISIDRPKEINKEREREYLSKATFPNYRADQNQIFIRYETLIKKQFKGTPTFILFNRQGQIAAHDAGVLKKGKLMEFINEND